MGILSPDLSVQSEDRQWDGNRTPVCECAVSHIAWKPSSVRHTFVPRAVVRGWGPGVLTEMVVAQGCSPLSARFVVTERLYWD